MSDCLDKLTSAWTERLSLITAMFAAFALFALYCDAGGGGMG